MTKVFIPELEGPLLLLEEDQGEFEITNYDSRVSIVATCEQGMVTLKENKIFYRAPKLIGDFGFTVNGIFFDVKIISKTTKPRRPRIVRPLNDFQGTQESVTFFSLPWKTENPLDKYQDLIWDFASDSEFKRPISNTIETQSNNDSISFFKIPYGEEIHARCRHRGILGIESEWSETRSYLRAECPTAEKPTILNPSLDTVLQQSEVVLMSSSFIPGHPDEKHSHSLWEFSQFDDFENLIFSKTTFDKELLQCGVRIPKNEGLFVRMRHIGSMGTETPWSDKRAILYKEREEINQPMIIDPSSSVLTNNRELKFRSSIFMTSEKSGRVAFSFWQVATDPEFNNLVVEQAVSKDEYYTEFAFKNAKPGVTYYIRMKFKSTDGWDSAWSESRIVKVCAILPPRLIQPKTYDKKVSPTTMVLLEPFATIGVDTRLLETEWELELKGGAKQTFKTNGELLEFKLPRLKLGKSYVLRGKNRTTNDMESDWSFAYEFTVRSEQFKFSEIFKTPLKPSKVFRGLQTSIGLHYLVARDTLFSVDNYGVEKVLTFNIPEIPENAREISSLLTLSPSGNQINQIYTYAVKKDVETKRYLGYASYVFDGKTVYLSKHVRMKDPEIKAVNIDKGYMETLSSFVFTSSHRNRPDEFIIKKRDEVNAPSFIVRMELEYLPTAIMEKRLLSSITEFNGVMSKRTAVLSLRNIGVKGMDIQTAQSHGGTIKVKNDGIVYSVGKQNKFGFAKEIPILDKNLGLKDRQLPIVPSENIFNSDFTMLTCIRDNHLMIFKNC